MKVPIIDGVLAVLDKIGGITENLTDGEQGEQRLNVKMIKDMKSDIDDYRKLTMLTDPLMMPKKSFRKYWKLRKGIVR
jgi:hypothetical protein